MRKDMADYDLDNSKYTQSLGCWHGFIAQQKMIAVKKHYKTTSNKTRSTKPNSVRMKTGAIVWCNYNSNNKMSSNKKIRQLKIVKGPHQSKKHKQGKG